MTTPTFSVGGLASGLDTNSLIDKLVQLESRRLELVTRQQDAVKLQITALGDVASRLSTLQRAAQALSDGGVLGVKTASSNTAFAAEPGASAAAGSYSVTVRRLATSAKGLSQAFAAGEVATGGTLHFAIRGASFDVDVADGASLSDVAFAIRQRGVPVSATALDTGNGSYLSITARNSGYPPGGAPSDGLAVTFTPTGSLGKALAFSVTDAQNAAVAVDGVVFQRSSNTISDAIPGVTLTLRALSPGVAPDGSGGTPEDLDLGNDIDATRSRLQTFVDAYNGVMALLQRQLAVAKDSNRGVSGLAGDATVRTLQSRLQGLVSHAVGGLGGVRALADLGVRTGSDGSLSIDAASLSNAVGRDAPAVNALFSTATTGIAAATASLVDAFTRPGDGLLVARQDNLSAQVRSLDRSAEAEQVRVALFKDSLVRQFAAMEQVVSQLKSVGSYLAVQGG